MTTPDEALRELAREAAEAATEVRPGPWKVWAMEVLADPKGTSNLADALPVARTSLLIDGKPRTHLADFIAVCDPTAVLALLDRLARAEALADEWDQPAQPYAIRTVAVPALRDALGLP